MAGPVRRSPARGGNGGQVLFIFLAALVALLGLAALGIDVGYLYSTRHELQRCADAGALAGASAFLNGNWADPSIKTLAEARARDYVSRDKVAESTLDPAKDVTIGFPQSGRVSVDASRTVNLFFSRMFLGPTKTVSARAVGEASLVDEDVRGLKPWGIPFPWDDADGNGLYEPGETVHRDCPDGVADPSRYFCPGTRVILKIGTPKNSPKNPSGLPSLQQEPGHFFALDFGFSGASGYRDAIETDSSAAFSVGDAIPLEPGNMVGPTVQGVNTLLSADPHSQWNSEKNLPESDLYHIDDGSWMNSPRVVRIPVYDPENALKTGKSEMVVAAFAGFWIESIEHHQGTVIGRYIQMRAFGKGGPGAGPSAGPVLKILRLVE